MFYAVIVFLEDGRQVDSFNAYNDAHSAYHRAITKGQSARAYKNANGIAIDMYSGKDSGLAWLDLEE